MFDSLASLEQKLIRVKRTIALEMKAITDLEGRIATKRANMRGLQADQERLEKLAAKKAK